jgi:catechol 2,3-dioxygenase-like lactoylglutathione lyase family enzyme
VDYELIIVRVFVRDFDRALDFYSNVLGMKVALRAEHFDWAQLDTGAAQLAIERVRPEQGDDEADDALVGRFVGVSLAVDDIDATYRTLRDRGVEFELAPTSMPWGGVLAHLRDPDGNVLSLVGEPKEETPGDDG